MDIKRKKPLIASWLPATAIKINIYHRNWDITRCISKFQMTLKLTDMNCMTLYGYISPQKYSSIIYRAYNMLVQFKPLTEQSSQLWFKSQRFRCQMFDTTRLLFPCPSAICIKKAFIKWLPEEAIFPSCFVLQIAFAISKFKSKSLSLFANISVSWVNLCTLQDITSMGDLHILI